MSMGAEGRHDPILVTGGSGYLAGFVLVQLLNAGRTVRTTIRDLARADAVRAILGRHAPTDRLTFHAADLLSDAGWDEAIAGTGAVIHVASPMPVREYRKQNLEKPAREGVRRVLETARRAGVGRVMRRPTAAFGRTFPANTSADTRDPRHSLNGMPGRWRRLSGTPCPSPPSSRAW